MMIVCNCWLKSLFSQLLVLEDLEEEEDEGTNGRFDPEEKTMSSMASQELGKPADSNVKL